MPAVTPSPSHVPVRVGGLGVHPGDLLHADANGVTSIPHEIAADVAQAAADYMAAESMILDYCKAGSLRAEALWRSAPGGDAPDRRTGQARARAPGISLT